MVYLPALLRIVAFAAPLALGVHQAAAADFLKFPVESAPDIVSKPVELGTGWYLRGDVGVSLDRGPLVTSLMQDAKKNRSVVDLGMGYKFNKWLRIDSTVSVNGKHDFAGSGFTVTCPYSLNQQVGGGGFLWNSATDTCSPQNVAQLRKTDLLLNAYVDLGSWAGLTPFVGVGAGVSMLKSASSLTYVQSSDGSVYGANLTPPSSFNPVWVDANNAPITSWTDGAGVVHQGQPPVSFSQQNWNRQANKTTYNLAWSLMGGVAYDLTPELKLELNYRYLNSGSYTSLSNGFMSPVKSPIVSQQVKVGFRYMLD